MGKKIRGTYDRSIKVSEAKIQKLRDAKTRSNAIRLYGNDKSMREALNRFYSASIVTREVAKMNKGGAVKPTNPTAPKVKVTPAQDKRNSSNGVPTKTKLTPQIVKPTTPKTKVTPSTTKPNVKVAPTRTKTTASTDGKPNKALIAAAGAVVAASAISRGAKVRKVGNTAVAKAKLDQITAKGSKASVAQKQTARANYGSKAGLLTKKEAKDMKRLGKMENAGKQTAAIRAKASARATQMRGVQAKIKAQGVKMGKAGLDYARTRKGQ